MDSPGGVPALTGAQTGVRGPATVRIDRVRFPVPPPGLR